MATHVPVLAQRSLDLLAPALEHAGAVVVDGTLGLGGHAEALLTRFPGLHLVGLDRDPHALALAAERLEPFADRVDLVHTEYDRVREALDDLGIDRVQGVLLDLGVSSMQLDTDERGFAYSRDAPLDMRMDPGQALTAEQVVNEADERRLTRIFRDYGEERLAQRYAQRIVRARESGRIRRSGELVAVLDAATPAAVRRSGHPAKRVFQALRIEVNGELASLETAVPAALDALAVDGRIVVLSYHSLEDRIVKRAMTARTVTTAPRDLPVLRDEDQPTFRMLTRGAPTASEAEVSDNPRAASVRLRAAQRVRGNASS